MPVIQSLKTQEGADLAQGSEPKVLPHQPQIDNKIYPHP